MPESMFIRIPSLHPPGKGALFQFRLRRGAQQPADMYGNVIFVLQDFFQIILAVVLFQAGRHEQPRLLVDDAGRGDADIEQGQPLHARAFEQFVYPREDQFGQPVVRFVHDGRYRLHLQNVFVDVAGENAVIVVFVVGRELDEYDRPVGGIERKDGRLPPRSRPRVLVPARGDDVVLQQVVDDVRDRRGGKPQFLRKFGYRLCSFPQGIEYLLPVIFPDMAWCHKIPLKYLIYKLKNYILNL